MLGSEKTILTVKHASIRDVPHCRSLNDVSYHELLDGLILRHTPGTVGATDGLDVSTALLGTTVIPSLLGL